MLNLTTSTSEMRLLHHFSQRRAKQKPVWHKLITRMKKICQQEHSQFWQTRCNASFGRHKRKSSRELEYERIKTILQIQKEQLLTEARSEILKHEKKANLTEDYIRGLKGQMESQDIGSQAYSRRECAIETRTESSSRRGSRSRTSLRENRIRGIHETEALKRTHEMRVDEFSKKKTQKIKVSSTGSWPRCRNYNMISSV